MKKVNIEISDDLFNELRKSCIHNHFSMRDAIVQILKNHYNTRSKG